MKVAVSFLSTDNYEKCVKKVNNTSADYMHIDLCDGKYVETKNFTLGSLDKFLKVSTKPLDVHLMVMDPLKYIDSLSLYNIDTITFHANSTKNPDEVIDYILSMGLKVGLALNPDDNIDTIMPYINKLDNIIVLSVYPGKGGQSFIEGVIPKIEALNEMKKDYHYIVTVDGGINADTIKYLNGKGVDIVVAGSFITNNPDYDEGISFLQKENK